MQLEIQSTVLQYYLVKFIHFIIVFLIVVYPFITKNIYALYAIILFDTVIIFSWYIYDDCILTIIEDKLNPKNTSISKEVAKYFGMEEGIFIYVPILSIIICLYFIDTMRRKCR